ncbi:MAG TPA: peptidase domain-containing ABC transporter [Gammaproteobacteria bacterium]|nr:peptidase domain-containing ABC transporter [Gammaproteobacteria bacterium]
MQWLDRLALGLKRRLPTILQTEAAECGLACIAMIASFYGNHSDLTELRRRHAVSLKGTTLASLAGVARRLGLASRAVRLELEDLGKLRIPCVLHWQFNHFVVLERAGPGWIRIHDPAFGSRRLSPRETSKAFTGVALELWPAPGFERRPRKPGIRLRAVLGRMTGLWSALAQILLLAAAIEVFAALSPLFLQWVIDHALLSGNRQLLTTLALAFGLLALFQHATTAVRAWVIMHIGATLNVQWHANVFGHLLRLPLPYFERRHLGDVVSRFRSIDVIRRSLSTAFVEAIVDGIMTFVVLLVVWLYSPLLTCVCAAAIVLYALIRALFYAPYRSAAEERIVHAAKQESHFFETVRGIRSIKLFQRQEERRAAWLALLVGQLNADLRTQKQQILLKMLNGLAFGIENVLVVWLGARLVLDGRFSVGMLMAFMAYKGQLSWRVGALIDKLFELKMLQLQAERLADIVLTPPEPFAARGRLVLGESRGVEPSIRIRGLRLKYAEHEPYVLDGVDLDVAAGESVVIAGASGSGKTTLLHVLLGVLPPTAGEVCVGRKPLQALGSQPLHAMIGCVTQNDTLFAGSIAENISFFDPAADQRWVEECARRASIHAEIEAMPMGYDTFVGYLGTVLSGGQQQRLLIARALYKRPSILVLDEATSHLDLKREALVSAAIRETRITRIIVAHRPQTAATADRILILEGGRIAREIRRSPNLAVLASTGC